MTNKPYMMIGDSPAYDFLDGSFGWGICGMDIDGDGSGGNPERDPDFQSTTSLRNADGSSINSRLVRGIVVPKPMIVGAPGIVLGCRAQVTDVLCGLTTPAVAYDEGPSDKAGEAAIATADFFGVPSNPLTGGTQLPRFFYRIWPGQAAFLNGVQYILKRFNG